MCLKNYLRELAGWLIVPLLLLSSQGILSAEDKDKTVIFISSYDDNNSWSTDIIKEIRSVISENIPRDYVITYKHIYLNAKEIGDSKRRETIMHSHLKEIRDYVDLVIVSGHEAISAVIASDDSILNCTPIVFEAFIDRDLIVSSKKNISGAVSSLDIDDTYAIATSMFPRARKLYIISDCSDVGKYFAYQARKQLGIYENEMEIIYDFSAASEDEMFDKVQRIESNALVFFLTWQRDDTGRAISASRVYPKITSFSAAPVFCFSNAQLAKGFIGGYVTTPSSFSSITGEIGANILKGNSPSIKIIATAKSVPIFNKDAIKKHNGRLSAIPPYSQMVNSLTGFIIDHIVLFGAVGVFLIIALLITFLVYYYVSYEKLKRMHIYSRELSIAKQRKDILSWQFNFNTNTFSFGEESKHLNIDPKEINTVQKFYLKVHPDFLSNMKEVFIKIYNNQISDFRFSYRADFQNTGDYQWWECRGEIFQTKKGKIAYGLLFNINEIKEKEELLKNALLEAQNADKLKSAFVANMSHEIRTPLNSILGFSQLISETDDQQEKKEYSEIIQKNGEALLNIVDGILDLSKIESGTIEYYREVEDFSIFFDFLSKSFKQLVSNPDVTFIADNPYKKCVLSIDKYRVKELYDNYISNAIKFTKSGYIKMGYKYENGGLKMYVSDTGMGIPEEKINTVFGRFEKINNHIAGTGIGLSICKAIIEKAGGVVGVESEFGKGSTFYAWIPREYEILEEK